MEQALGLDVAHFPRRGWSVRAGGGAQAEGSSLLGGDSHSVAAEDHLHPCPEAGCGGGHVQGDHREQGGGHLVHGHLASCVHVCGGEGQGAAAGG